MISKQWLGRCISRGSPCGVLEIRNSRSYSTVYYSVYSYSVYVYISRGLPRSAIPFISRISRGLPRSIPYISRVSRGLPRSAIPTFLQTRRGCRGCAGRSSPPVHRKRGSAIARRPKRRPATTGTRLNCECTDPRSYRSVSYVVSYESLNRVAGLLRRGRVSAAGPVPGAHRLCGGGRPGRVPRQHGTGPGGAGRAGAKQHGGRSRLAPVGGIPGEQGPKCAVCACACACGRVWACVCVKERGARESERQRQRQRQSV